MRRTLCGILYTDRVSEWSVSWLDGTTANYTPLQHNQRGDCEKKEFARGLARNAFGSFFGRAFSRSARGSNYLSNDLAHAVFIPYCSF